MFVFSLLHVYHSGDTLEYLDCTMSSTPSNYKSVHNNRFHGDEDHDPRSDLSQGGGDDAVHPTIIPMYTSTTPQAPKRHTIRPRPYAMGHKVNSLLFEPYLPTYETWLLPHAWTLCILRLIRDDHGDSKDQGQAWKRIRKKREEDGAAAGVSPDVRTSLRIIRTQPDHSDALPDHPGNPTATTPEACRILPAKPDHPDEDPDHPDDARIIRTPIRIIRPLPARMTWAEARVPLLMRT